MQIHMSRIEFGKYFHEFALTLLNTILHSFATKDVDVVESGEES
jgi:hypothetical protein